MIVDNLARDYLLYLGEAWHTKCGYLCLDNLMSIQIVPARFVDFVAPGVGLAFGSGGSLDFCYILVAFYFRRLCRSRVLYFLSFLA